MNGRYQVIDEVSLSILGTFESQDAATEFVATVMLVNDDEFLDELTIADSTGPILFGDALRDTLRRRVEARERVA
jgi:hypothetical protein